MASIEQGLLQQAAQTALTLMKDKDKVGKCSQANQNMLDEVTCRLFPTLYGRLLDWCTSLATMTTRLAALLRSCLHHSYLGL